MFLFFYLPKRKSIHYLRSILVLVNVKNKVCHCAEVLFLFFLVQARLEETSFFVDHPSRSSLPQQIHYLLLYYDDLNTKNVR